MMMMMKMKTMIRCSRSIPSSSLCRPIIRAASSTTTSTKGDRNDPVSEQSSSAVVASTQDEEFDDSSSSSSSSKEQSQSSSGKSKTFRKQPRLVSRRFLTHPGVPEGTLFQREQMAKSLRQSEANHRVNKHKMRRLGFRDDELEETQDETGSGPRRAQAGIMSLVEDQINRSKLRGEFENLQGKGKPLERLEEKRTPGVDRTTDLFMDILNRNGVVPEWIERGKRVREMSSLLQRRIDMELALAFMEANPQAESNPDHPIIIPCSPRFASRVNSLASVREDLTFINREVDTYNLQVPHLHLQRLRLKLDPLIETALLSPPQKYIDAHRLVRMGQRDGSMGVTCLLEHRAEFLDDGDSGSGLGGYLGSASSSSSSSGSYYAAHRKRREDPTAHLFQAIMIPVDGVARFFANLMKRI